MSRELTKMNLIAIVQQLPKDDIEVIQTYISMIEQENNQLKEQLKTKHEGFMASVEQNCEYATILIELRSWLEDELKDCDNYSRHIENNDNYSRYIENKLQELKARSSGKTYIANEIMKNEVAKKCFKDVLNKLNKLEGGKNE